MRKHLSGSLKSAANRSPLANTPSKVTEIKATDVPVVILAKHIFEVFDPIPDVFSILSCVHLQPFWVYCILILKYRNKILFILSKFVG